MSKQFFCPRDSLWKSALKSFLFLLLASASTICAQNQTPDVSEVITDTSEVPFTVKIERTDFSLPAGLQSFVVGTYKGEWLLLTGRTNGLHGFGGDGAPFPPQERNMTLYVVNPVKKYIYSRSLNDPHSGLSQKQIDILSVSNAQRFQSDDVLYIIGGYGYNSGSDSFETMKTLTALDLPGVIEWVKHPHSHKKLSHSIRSTTHSQLRVTGGFMDKTGDNKAILIFGQNFRGVYTDSSNGAYTRQIRRFYIKDNGKKVRVASRKAKPKHPDASYRRRDLNVVPVIQKKEGKLKQSYVAYSGVFTPSGGAWTVPVEISTSGTPKMKNPDSDRTFKQAMNNYTCATAGIFSRKESEMFTLFFGGISYGYFDSGVFQTDSEFPFINQVTAIKRDSNGTHTQYLLDASYPVMYSTGSNPGNQLLFGAGALFIPKRGIPRYSNDIIKLEDLKKGEEMTVGYIVGGIQSTLPNTNTQSDTAASPYIFRVKIMRK